MTPEAWASHFKRGKRVPTRDNGRELWRGADIRHLFAHANGLMEACIHSKQTAALWYFVTASIALNGDDAGRMATHTCSCSS